MKKLIICACILGSGFLNIVAAVANESISYKIPRSEVHEINSKILGRTYEVFVKLPRGYELEENADKKYPVIYSNDGPYTFQVGSGVLHLSSLDKAVLVGISFAKGENGMSSRVRDLTPEIDKSWTKYQTGGAVKYLQFLEEEAMVFIENKYRIDETKRVLTGQSLGGSFGAWVLLTKPKLFAYYILTSPSLWFKNEMIFDVERQYAASHEDLKAKVYLTVGEQETRDNGMQNDMVEEFKRFTRQLHSRHYPGLDMRSEISIGTTHETTYPIGFTKGMLWFIEDF